MDIVENKLTRVAWATESRRMANENFMLRLVREVGSARSVKTQGSGCLEFAAATSLVLYAPPSPQNLHRSEAETARDKVCCA